jgi:transcriptional regulator of acetoin/glycerol metabolism
MPGDLMMSSVLADPARHAHRIMGVVQRHEPARTSDIVAGSWARCLNDYNLDPSRLRHPAVLDRAGLDARMNRCADVIDAARFEMTTLYQQLADPESAVVLTDTEGVILHMVSSPDFEHDVQPLGFHVGAIWSEAEAGTNGMGTCLVAARPVSVRQDDHFFSAYTSLTCSAVPIYDPSGQLCAVLDVTSRSQLAQQHVLVLLGMTARMIENRLIDRRFREAHPVHFHSRPEFVYTLHEGRLVLDDDGRVLAANRSALLQLGLQHVGEVRSRRIEDLFQSTLDDMLARCSASSFHPVVTYRQGAAHRFFAVVRPSARQIEDGAGRVGGPAGREAKLGGAPGGMGGAYLASAQAKANAIDVTPGREKATTPRDAGAPTFDDPQLSQRLATARRVIARGTPILLHGETGAGKEVFARAVHQGSPRASGTFVAINCASLPEHLIEAELFGYRAGAFTGAERRGRRGKIAQADGGTLFLDEIGDMPLSLQARLLRVLDEREVTPLGADEAQKVDFQLMSASHRHLPSLVREGRFREDLYYRLAGVELKLPALRERRDRAALIAAVLRDEGGSQVGPDAEMLLMSHPWPGNVRQLRHVLRGAIALADGGTVTSAHLPTLRNDPGHGPGLHGGGMNGGSISGMAAGKPGAYGGSLGGGLSNLGLPTGGLPNVHGAGMGGGLSMPMGHGGMGGGMGGDDGGLPSYYESPVPLNPMLANERQTLLQLLEQQRWNVSQVAKTLNVSRNTLYRKLHKLHIPLSHPND